MLHFGASELGLHCLHNTPKWVFGLKTKYPFWGIMQTLSALSATLSAILDSSWDDKINLNQRIYIHRKYALLGDFFAGLRSAIGRAFDS